MGLAPLYSLVRCNGKNLVDVPASAGMRHAMTGNAKTVINGLGVGSVIGSVEFRISVAVPTPHPTHGGCIGRGRRTSRECYQL
jgi:hypothetical protein